MKSLHQAESACHGYQTQLRKTFKTKETDLMLQYLVQSGQETSETL